ncbi:MAG: methyltransferase domain-containing protein [Verrucomicrobiales bacterium]
MSAESFVKSRYAAAASEREPELCCPVDYNPKFLEVIPREVIERDYGCGDPSKYLRRGETVLDLGSGTGKIAFIASQVVGESGRVIGVDMTDDMLTVARENAPKVAQRVGFSNVEFRKGRIQDLALDLELFDARLREESMSGVEGFLKAEEIAAKLRESAPLISTGSVDVVVSNCVLNLVDATSKPQLFGEIFRVLRSGGRAVISDIVCDEEVPVAMQSDEELWSGCISGALTEERFLEAFEEAGFHGLRILKREEKPWRTVGGIEFRSVTIEAFTGKTGPCFERKQAVIYKGPFKKVEDDDGHVMERGKRHAVCDKTYKLYQTEPYRGLFEAVEPAKPVPLERAEPFDCESGALRHPRETKGEETPFETEGPICRDGGGCC